MKTALDIYKQRYGSKEDGETVFKHAELGNFRDSVMGTILGREELKQLDIEPKMSREEILYKLRMTTRETEAIALRHRHAIEQVIDFCDTSVMQTSGFHEAKKPKISISRVLDPILDAIERRIFTGSFFKKPKK